MSTVNNEGNLIFDSVEENGQRVYVAEFKATGPFSLHIERRESGRITVYQKSYENGKYATVKNVDIAPQDTIIDAEVPGGVFPKWIKIKSSSAVEVAEVTFESESSGGGAGESTMEYLDVSGLSEMDRRAYLEFSFYVKLNMNGSISIALGTMTDIRSATANIVALGIDPNATIIASSLTTTVLGYIEMTGMLDAYNAIPRITKEQFYNLEA